MVNPFVISEVQKSLNSVYEIKEATKAFENTKNEVKAPKHITTKNEGLEGSEHPKTGVIYINKCICLYGEKVEGVFPKFDSKYDVKLPKDMYYDKDEVQFKYCIHRLDDQIKRNPKLGEQFTSRQLEQIKNGEPRISGLTWHHNEVEGKMQLVDADKHQISGHTGGRSLWGGGQECR